MTDLDWWDQRACRNVNPDVFFPVLGRHLTDTEIDALCADAKAVCRGCPVRDDCLQYAIDVRASDGVFGGMSPRERWRLVRKQGSTGRRLSPHGTRARYAYGCRCAVCVVANRRYQRARQKSQKRWSA